MVFSSILCSSIDTQLGVKHPSPRPSPPPPPQTPPGIWYTSPLIHSLTCGIFCLLIIILWRIQYFLLFIVSVTSLSNEICEKRFFNGQDLKNCARDLFSFLTILCKLPRKYKKAQFLFSFIFTCQNVVFIIYFAYGCSNMYGGTFWYTNVYKRVWGNLVHFCENWIWQYIF